MLSCALRLASIISARSSGCSVSFSKTAIVCGLSSSKTWKASTGRSGAGRLCSSSTLTRTLTRFTVTLILPRSCAGSGTSAFGVDVAATSADLFFCAQGGRLGFSCCRAKESARSATATATMTTMPTKCRITCRRGRKRSVGIELVGCRFCGWSLRSCGCRWNFAIRPNGSVREELFLPDWDRFFQGIDRVAAGVEGRRAMRRAHRDEHAGLAYFQPPEPVYDRHPVDGEIAMQVRGDFLHFAKRHGFISFVFQIKRGSHM